MIASWKASFLISCRVKVLECSAKDDQNVTDLFKTLLSLPRFLPVGSNNDGTSGLKRRSLAYVSASSSGSKYTHSQIYTEKKLRETPEETVLVIR